MFNRTAIQRLISVILMFALCHQLNAQQDTTKYKPNHLYYEDNPPLRHYLMNGHYIHLTSYLNENANSWKEFEIQFKNRNRGMGFVMLGLGFAAAALGQIGQKENRALPFAVMGGVSMALSYPFYRAEAKHEKLSIKNYNDGILSKYAKEDSAIYKSKLVLYDNVQKTLTLDGRGFCLTYYLRQYPLAWKEYQLSKRKETPSVLFTLIGLSGLVAAVGQIGQTNNRGRLLAIGGLSAFTIGVALTNNKKSKKHLENAVNYYNARM